LITQTENVPVTLLHNLKHNKVRHHTVLLVRVVTENIPRVAGGIGNEALDDFELGLERFGFLDRDHPLVADPLHCLLASIGALGRKASSILCLISAGVGLTPGLLLLVV